MFSPHCLIMREFMGLVLTLPPICSFVVAVLIIWHVSLWKYCTMHYDKLVLLTMTTLAGAKYSFLPIQTTMQTKSFQTQMESTAFPKVSVLVVLTFKSSLGPEIVNMATILCFKTKHVIVWMKPKASLATPLPFIKPGLTVSLMLLENHHLHFQDVYRRQLII